jgi:flagellar biosynthesis protein FlhG
MPDQANNLRQLVRQGPVPPPPSPVAAPRLLVLTGGRGGVGTTTVTVNVAIALARQGCRTLLADADPRGGHVVDLLQPPPSGVLPDGSQPTPTVERIFEAGPAGLTVVPADATRAWLDLDPAAVPEPLVRRLDALAGRFDFVVVDSGSGPTRSACPWWQAADAVWFLTTTDPASVMATYGSIKTLVSARPTVRVYGLVNRARCRSAARQTRDQLDQASRRFLGIRLEFAGYLEDDPAVAEAAQPVVIGTPRSRVARRLRRMATALVRQAKRSAGTR